MASMQPSKLLTPPSINTSPHASASLDVSSPPQQPQTDSPRRNTSTASQLTLQVPSSPMSLTADGDTLRTQRTSRSGSFRSFAETTHSAEGPDTAALLHPSSRPKPNCDPLSPDPGNAEDFNFPNNPFAFSPGQLNKLLNPKSLAALKALGGITGLEKGLITDLKAGLSQDESTIAIPISFHNATGKEKFESVSLQQEAASHVKTDIEGQSVPYRDRITVFKTNRLPTKKGASFLTLLWRAYNDRIIMLLTGAAVISLALGIYEAASNTSSVDWIEGVAIVVAILIVVIVTAISDFRRERAFSKLNAKKDDREVRAIRSGKSCLVSVHDILTGDVCQLEAGDIVPADGILISGHRLTCDESSVTGESDAVRKQSAHRVHGQFVVEAASENLDPFIISGTKVIEGLGTFLVTSVGPYSSHGKIMMSLRDSIEPTPLQVKLAKIANWIGGLGGAAAGLLFAVLLIRFLAGLSSNLSSPAQKGSQFLDILIVAVTIIVVAVPEGLPLSVLLALSFATKKMYKDNNLVRHLRACETMGNCTTVCSDKTGTLTQNKMTVVAGLFGDAKSSVEGSDLVKGLAGMPEPFQRLVIQSIAINSTATEGSVNGAPFFLGSKTETALLSMARDHLGMGPLSEERAASEIISIIPFDSAQKFSGAVVRLSTGKCRLLLKGAAELLLSKATTELTDVSRDTFSSTSISAQRRETLERTLNAFAERSLRTIAILYTDLDDWSYTERETQSENGSAFDLESFRGELTFIGIVGIHDPLREDVPEAVKRCQTAGIKVRMVTGDNVTTATAIATSCGIKTTDGITMEGPAFRRLSAEEMDKILPKLEVLARSSPEDKRILVANLKRRGETVAVTGDGTNDAPALKTGDVGFSMGLAGTEVAKSASDIILLDDNFSSIVKATMWGRSVNDAVQKFLQFQVTVNIAAVILAFVSAVYSPEGNSVLTAVQLLWINLVMDTFAALALATDPASESMLNRLPSPKSAPLITANMWKMIVGQAIYQLAVTFVLYFAGAQILGYDIQTNADGTLSNQQVQLDTIVFNVFVWMQIFNMFNNRRLDNAFNVFEGIQRNFYFMGILLIMVAGQVLIIFVGGVAFQITALNATQWGISISCALPCLLWAICLRCIPDEYAQNVIKSITFACTTVLAPLVLLSHAAEKKWGRFYGGFKRALKRGVKHQEPESKEKSGDIESGVMSTAGDNVPPITFTSLD